MAPLLLGALVDNQGARLILLFPPVHPVFRTLAANMSAQARDTANDGEASTLVASRSRLDPKWMHSPGSPDQLPRVHVRDEAWPTLAFVQLRWAANTKGAACVSAGATRVAGMRFRGCVVHGVAPVCFVVVAVCR